MRPFLHPGIKGCAQRLPFILDSEINQRCGATKGRCARAGLKIIGAGGTAKRHVEMCVHIDPARHDILIFCINHARRVFTRQVLADGRNLAAADGNVSRVGISGRDHCAVYDEGIKGHRKRILCYTRGISTPCFREG